MLAIVTTSNIKTGKNGNYWIGDLKIKDKVIAAIIWDVGSVYPNKGDIINIIAFKDQLDTRNNIILQNYETIKREDIKDEDWNELVNIKIDHERIHSAYDSIIKTQYQSEAIKIFVHQCLFSLDHTLLLKCPAGKTKHHVFTGGLLIHTNEVLQIAKAIADAFPYPHLLNKDILMASCVLHDLGKVKTYLMNEYGVPEHRSIEHSIGHIYFSMHIISSIQEKSKLLEEGIYNDILHCVAAHHGRVEYGAIKEPLNLEAIMLNQADYLSARGSGTDMNREYHKEHSSAVRQL